MKHYIATKDGQLIPTVYPSLPLICKEYKISYSLAAHGKRTWKHIQIYEVQVIKRKGNNKRGNKDNLKKVLNSDIFQH